MDAAALNEAAARYVGAWARGDEGAVRGMLAGDVVFRGDGVVWLDDLKGPEAVIASLRRDHAAEPPSRYEVVAAAADPSERAAFTAVAWERGAGGGAGAGLTLKELLFDEAGRVRVALLSDPSSCRPADLFAELLPRLQPASRARAQPADGELAAAMRRALGVWDAAWGSDGPGAERLREVCAENFRVLDGYGLHGSGPSYGLDAAVEMVSDLRRGSYSATTQLHCAVDPATRVGFSRWEGKGVSKTDADSQTRLGGFDMCLFDSRGRLETLVQFTMKNYPQLAARKRGGREGGAVGAPAGA
ncbi:hypothetical protein Rsub_09550 [Raphidocelis subcapitata]|uniref:SnoaL-like domain-containing protein n=1 Tax=Raphidocelis subcapitata TaxID=307507 RepID=A0A2V0PIF5_9CHLO|nr:hypothetical protein Rsub_09550 [Raphidocelis subcapitata]|eukprot:GBF97077.1 hypothetical protein Rsub_09550 [Raphidocelis subcapitata]